MQRCPSNTKTDCEEKRDPDKRSPVIQKKENELDPDTQLEKRKFAANACDLDEVYGSGHSNMLGKRSSGQSADSIGAISTLLSLAWSL